MDGHPPLFVLHKSQSFGSAGSRVKILLIQPPKAPSTIGGEDLHVYEPLALEYVASGVAEDHDVKILDMRLDRDLTAALDDFRPDVVGITSYTVHVNTAKRLFDHVKRWNPDVLTVVGGHHATVCPEDFLTPSIDLIVSGEGVFVFKEIVRRFEAGERIEGVPGTTFRKGEETVRTPAEPAVDLDAFPFPHRGVTAKYRRRYFSEWMRPLASIRTSKGCPFRCSFCALWKLTGGQYFKRTPESIVRELAEIDEDFVFFADDESLVDAARMKTLAHLIREAGIRKRYFLYGRSDTIVRYPELLEMWREIGLERIFVGLEFFRDDDLKYIRKGSTASENRSAVRILQDLGIDTWASFIVRPEFRKEDFAEFRRYCRSLGLNFASFAVLTPLPGTDLYEEVRDGLLTHNYDHFDFLHALLPTSLPLKDFYQEFSSLLRQAVPLGKRLSLLRKFPVTEIPSLLMRSYRLVSQIRNAYKDYEW